jgi:hypothetical protein
MRVDKEKEGTARKGTKGGEHSTFSSPLYDRHPLLRCSQDLIPCPLEEKERKRFDGRDRSIIE